MKRILCTLTIIALLWMVPLQVLAEEKSLEKDEVVYGVLDEKGKYDVLYVVNKFRLPKDGTYSDYGAYESVKNLTNLEDMLLADGKVSFTGDKGVFHYEGILKEASLPWDFTVSYELDGEKMEPAQLAGETGHVKIRFESVQNKAGEVTFFDHYMLQIGANFPMEDTDQLTAEKGMIANAGDDYQVTFTAMPEEENQFVIEADVTDFQFDGFEINALPSFMDIEDPDTDKMEGDMNTLQKAIADIHSGLRELRDGLGEFHGGANELYKGSETYKDGMDTLASEVKDAAQDLDEAFIQFDEVMDEFDGVTEEDLQDVLDLLDAFPSELKELRKELKDIQKDFLEANKALKEAMNGLPNEELSEEQIDALKESDLEEEAIDILLNSYEATKEVQDAFADVEIYDEQVSIVFDTLLEQIDEMIENAAQLEEMLGDMTSASTMLAELSNVTEQYDAFQDGIKEMTDGIMTLASSYSEIHDGIGELSSGSKELEDGASALYDGAGQLKKGTDQLPDKLKEEIDALMEKYDKSDFDMVSFVSDKNEEVEMVQFVMKTEAIEIEEEEVVEEEKEEKTMWQRFLDLFTWLKFWD